MGKGRGLSQRPWFLPLATLGFIVVGLVLVTDGKDGDRSLGLGVLLFFGVGGGAALVGNRWGRRDPVTIGPVEIPGGARVDGLVLPCIAVPAGLRIIGGVAIVAGCAFVATAMGPGIGALLVAGCGAIMAIALIQRLRPGGLRAGSLALTRWGLLLETGAERTAVPWSAVAGVREVTYQGQPMLMIGVMDGAAVVRRNGSRVMEAVGERFYGSNTVPLSLRTFGLPEGQVLAVVQRFLMASRASTASTEDTWPSIRTLAGDLLPAAAD
jgi:hypothetical protein